MHSKLRKLNDLENRRARGEIGALDYAQEKARLVDRPRPAARPEPSDGFHMSLDALGNGDRFVRLLVVVAVVTLVVGAVAAVATLAR